MAALLNGSKLSGFYDCLSFVKKHKTSWPNIYSFQRLSKDFTMKCMISSTAQFDWSSIPSGGGNWFKKRGINVLHPQITAPSFALEFLDASEDEYDGVIVDPEILPSSANAFVSALRASLSYWKSKEKKGVWLKILQERADLVPIAIQEGFSYHHSEPGYLMLTYWIPDEPCRLPGSPSHQIGVGGFVINLKKSSNAFFLENHFLLTQFFRKWSLSAFDNSDILFMCMLKPLSSEITIDEKEIQAAKLMLLDELVGQPFYLDDHMSRKAIDVCVEAYEDRYNGFIARQLTSKLDGKLSHLYYSH